MNRNLFDFLNKKTENHILPFFWQHGDNRLLLKQTMDAIKSTGVDSFCVESRTHEEFGNDKWWDDFGFILKEAKERNMTVWLLDDKHFPSGFANDYLRSHQELVRKVIREEHLDIRATGQTVSLLANRCKPDEKLLCAVAYKRLPGKEKLSDEFYNISDKITDSVLTWKAPEGIWRVFFIIESTGPLTAKNDAAYYVDMLSEKSCHAMIDAVYQPHYDHFKEYFGNTFKGFFSDEPCFNNESGTYYSKLGKKDSVLPWNRKVLELLRFSADASDADILCMLPGLWFDTESNYHKIRYAYMDSVSKLYSKNFSVLLGNWCREHNVLYIGHVIEDMDANMRLGYGTAHFFRALAGQDMSGIDVVLHQIVPGLNECTHNAMIADDGIANPEFFDYTLAKLGVSVAHTDTLKKGRCFCEMFGAYGWAEGLPMMKHLSDHMIVNGVNYFVPHAFTDRYPNDDCPPHFYANGSNAQFKYMGDLFGYMNRCVNILSEGVHKADVAVLYDPEGEWCGGDFMPFGKVTSELTKNQIDFDFVSFDTLTENAKVKCGRLVVGNETYNSLIVSKTKILPLNQLNVLVELAKCGLPIIFIDSLPTEYIDDIDGLTLSEYFSVVSLKRIAKNLKVRNFCHIQADKYVPNLRFYHKQLNDCNVVMFMNDSVDEDIDVKINLPFKENLVWYDAWTQKCYPCNAKKNNVKLKLPASSTIFLISNFEYSDSELDDEMICNEKIEANLDFDISIREADYKWNKIIKSRKLCDITSLTGMSYFSGEIRYETKFVAENSGIKKLDLGFVGETAKVILNGVSCGIRIQSPYIFDIQDNITQGENTLEIIVANNPAYMERDRFSKYLAINPSGIMGPIKFLK